MSKASASREIKYIRKGLTYTSWITSSKGDLWQEYTGEANGDLGTISPSYTTESNQPTLQLVVMSSKSQNGTVDVSANMITWYINDVVIDPTSSAHKSYFKFDGANLVIIGNLATLTGGVSCVIKASATITADGYTDVVTAAISCSIKKTSGTSSKVTIIAGDSKNFKIDTNDGSCVLAVSIFNNGSYATDSDIRSKYSYKWYKLVSGAWTEFNTGYSVSVKASDVDTYADFKVEVENSSGVAIGSDIAGVWDVSDGYYILPHPTPSDETIVAGSSDSVTYAPVLYSKNPSGTDTVVSVSGYYFTVLDSVGGQVKTSAGAVTTFTVNESDCANYGDVTVNIESVEF